ncbi:unnamed protein product, partial [marine sediment metagenome]
ITFISILAFLVFYIFQVNALTNETYLIQSCEEKLGQLSGENETLEVNFSKANSLTNIEINVIVKKIFFIDRVFIYKNEGEEESEVLFDFCAARSLAERERGLILISSFWGLIGFLVNIFNFSGLESL